MMVWLRAHFAKTQQVVKQFLASDVPKHLSANALVDCALVHTQNLATLGSRICLPHLRWHPELTHLWQESVLLEHHLTWKDLHTEDHETQTEREVCLFICVTMGIVIIMPRELLFHFRESNVVSSRLDNGVAMTNPHVCTTFMPVDNSWTQPTH